MSLIKKLAGQTVYYGLSSILGRVFSYLVLSIYLANVLPTESFGELGFMYVFVAFMLALITFRMETTFFRFASRAEDKDQVFSTALLFVAFLAITIGGSVYLFSDDIAHFLGHGNHVYYFQILIVVAVLDALVAIPFARLRLENKPLKFAVFKLLNVLINIFFVMFFLKLAPFTPDFMAQFGWVYNDDMKLDYVFWANLIASSLTLILFLPMFKKLKFNLDTTLIKKMFRYSFPLVIVGVAAMINDLIGIVLVEYWTPGSVAEQKEAVGFYNAIAKLAVLMNLFVQAYNFAAEPFFFNQASKKESKPLYANVTLAFTMVACMVFLGIALFSEEVILLVGEKYYAGLYILPYLLLGNLMLGIYYNIGIWYKLKDMTWYGAKIALVGAFITITLNILLLPILGILGAAIAKMACYTVMVAMAYYYGQKFFKVPYDIKKMIFYVLITIIFYVGATFLIDKIEWHNAFLIFVKILVFITFVLGFWKIEKNQIKSLLKL